METINGGGLKGFLTLALLGIFGGTTCFAQSTASAYVGISATVVKGISTTSANGLSFGAIATASGTHTVSPYGSHAGSFTMTGQSGSVVAVTLSDIVILHDNNGHTITFKPATPIWNTINSQTAGEQEFPKVTGGTVVFNSTGQLHVWLGGYLNTDGASIGSYSGNYTISISY